MIASVALTAYGAFGLAMGMCLRAKIWFEIFLVFAACRILPVLQAVSPGLVLSDPMQREKPADHMHNEIQGKKSRTATASFDACHVRSLPKIHVGVLRRCQ